MQKCTHLMMHKTLGNCQGFMVFSVYTFDRLCRLEFDKKEIFIANTVRISISRKLFGPFYFLHGNFSYPDPHFHIIVTNKTNYLSDLPGQLITSLFTVGFFATIRRRKGILGSALVAWKHLISLVVSMIIIIVFIYKGCMISTWLWQEKVVAPSLT